MPADLVSEQVGFIAFDGFRVDRRPAAAARDSQRINKQLPGIIAYLAASHLPVHHDELAVIALIDQIRRGRDRRARQREIQRELGKVRGTGRKLCKKGLLPGEVPEAVGNRCML